MGDNQTANLSHVHGTTHSRHKRSSGQLLLEPGRYSPLSRTFKSSQIHDLVLDINILAYSESYNNLLVYTLLKIVSLY